MFIDTDVLVKSRILEAPDHDIARARLERAFQNQEPMRISRQVLREYLSVVTRPQTWPIPITREDALDDVNRLMGTFEILEDGPVVTETLIELCREVSVGGRQIHGRQGNSGHHPHPQRRGYRQPTGRLWSKNGVQIILRNEAYTGKLVRGFQLRLNHQ